MCHCNRRLLYSYKLRLLCFASTTFNVNIPQLHWKLLCIWGQRRIPEWNGLKWNKIEELQVTIQNGGFQINSGNVDWGNRYLLIFKFFGKLYHQLSWQLTGPDQKDKNEGRNAVICPASCASSIYRVSEPMSCVPTSSYTIDQLLRNLACPVWPL